MRIFEHNRVWALEQKALDQALDLIFKEALPFNANLVVGIARGGRVPAQKLSEKLKLPYFEVRACHNLSDDVCSQHTEEVQVQLDQTLTMPTPARIILVDDICGTGKTLQSVSNTLHSLWAYEKALMITLCCNSGSSFMPDLYVWRVSDWVVFPWEQIPADCVFNSLPSPRP